MKHKPVKQSDFFSVKEGKLERKGRVCNRCGDGTFMAEHEDRFYCGKCGLTIWKENKSQKL